MKASLSFLEKPDKEKILSVVSDLLASNGFNEIMSNSLTKSSYFEDEEIGDSVVKIYNPLSSDLNAMRKTLLFGGLEAIAYNSNRQNPDLRLFEFGNIYRIRNGVNSENKLDKYLEEERMALFLTGENNDPNWASGTQLTNFFHIKAFTELILKRLGFDPDELETSSPELRFLEESFQYSIKGAVLAVISRVHSGLIKQFDIKNEVYYADIHWNSILNSITDNQTLFTALPRYPEVKRDLSMILEKSVKYEDIKKVAKRAGGALLKKINLFDVYEGGQVGNDKKSYAISFTLRDENKTLTDAEIDTVMDRITRKLEKEIGVQIRR
jgi:phenylalanyl-tRNA synthetase beta chain